MLKIGEFSKLSRVSVRMLRYYDEIGLLKPARTDLFTDYRYYREDQLPVICRITSLRRMGFSLAQIARLPDGADRAEEEAQLLQRQEELRRQLCETQERLKLTEAALTRLRKDEPMQFSVNIKTFPARYAAVVHMTVPSYEDEGMAWQILNEETESLHLIPDDPCLCAATFFDGEYKEKDVELAVSKTVKGHYPDTKHVTFRTLPEVTAACCTFKGGYDLMTEVYGAVFSWMEQNGYTGDGPMFNHYHVSPHETDDPNEFVTEVCCPVRKV